MAARSIPLTPEAPATNGTALIRLPRRTPWLELPGEYGEVGMRVRIWANYGAELVRDRDLTQREELLALMREIILEHNGWATEEGVPFPSPSTEEFWAIIPPELVDVLIILALQAREQLPNSMRVPGRS
jgi:hypothetical protein